MKRLVTSVRISPLSLPHRNLHFQTFCGKGDINVQSKIEFTVLPTRLKNHNNQRIGKYFTQVGTSRNLFDKMKNFEKKITRSQENAPVELSPSLFFKLKTTFTLLLILLLHYGGSLSRILIFTFRISGLNSFETFSKTVQIKRKIERPVLQLIQLNSYNCQQVTGNTIFWQNSFFKISSGKFLLRKMEKLTRTYYR